MRTPLTDQICETFAVSSIAEAIAALQIAPVETDEPPIEAVIAGLRTIAEKRGCNMSAPAPQASPDCQPHPIASLSFVSDRASNRGKT